MNADLSGSIQHNHIHTHRKRNSGVRSLLGLTAMAMAVGGAVNSHAQQGRNMALEEIVVTAQRRAEGLQTIPVSIAAVTAEDLAAKGITDFDKLTDTVSGISLSRPGSAISTGMYIRGVGTAGTSPAAQSVGVMIDGVYLKRQGAAFNELMDIQRVEVLRGPQGTLFGKNTTAGMINVVTAESGCFFGPCSGGGRQSG